MAKKKIKIRDEERGERIWSIFAPDFSPPSFGWVGVWGYGFHSAGTLPAPLVRLNRHARDIKKP